MGSGKVQLECCLKLQSRTQKEKARAKRLDSEGHCAVWIRWNTWNKQRTQQKLQDLSMNKRRSFSPT